MSWHFTRHSLQELQRQSWHPIAVPFSAPRGAATHRSSRCVGRGALCRTTAQSGRWRKCSTTSSKPSTTQEIAPTADDVRPSPEPSPNLARIPGTSRNPLRTYESILLLRKRLVSGSLKQKEGERKAFHSLSQHFTSLL